MNTSGNDLLHSLLRVSSVECKKNLEVLMGGDCIEVGLQEQIVFSLLEKDADSLWNFLYFTGYLKAESILYPEEGGLPIARLRIPNQEIAVIFKQSIVYWFQDSEGYECLKNLRQCLKIGDGEGFSDVFEKLASKSLSYFDVGGEEPERFYHAFTLGLIVTLSEFWYIQSNREAGIGRCDILMRPKIKDYFGVVIELKTHKPKRDKDLMDTAQKALEQIETKQYAKELQQEGFQKVLKIGIAFMGKELEIISVKI